MSRAWWFRDTLADGNTILERFIIYCWPEYRMRSREEKKRLLDWLLYDNTVKGTREERNLKLRLEPIMGFIAKIGDDVENLRDTDENGQSIMHVVMINYVQSEEDLPEERTLGQLENDCIMVRNLIHAGATIIGRDHNGVTPLSIAVEKNRLDVVQICPISIISNDLGETFLHILLKIYPRRKVEADDQMAWQSTIEHITRRHKKWSISDVNGMTLILYAAMKSYHTMLNYVNRNAGDLASKTNHGDGLLILCCKNITLMRDTVSLENTINTIFYLGCDLHQCNLGGHSALHYAAQSQHLHIVKRLVKCGANAKRVGFDGMSPLHSAVMSSNVDASNGQVSSSGVVEYLIECGVDTKLDDQEFGFSMIHLAAFNRDVTIFDRFLEPDLDVNKPSNDGLTALHLAAIFANTGVATKLIDLNADVNCRSNTWQYTPLHLAAMGGQIRSLDDMDVLEGEEQLSLNYRSLIKHCFSRVKFKASIENDYVGMIELLLNSGANVDERDVRGRTPLHCAARQPKLDVVEALLKGEADVDALDNDGNLPIQHAIRANIDNYDVIDLLLKYGAHIDDIQLDIKDIYVNLKVHKFTIADRLLRHVAKLECARLPVGRFHMSQHKALRIQSFKPKFQQEIDVMKKRMLKDNVSIYDMFYMTTRQRATFVDRLPCNSEIALGFPNYGTVIHGRCREAVNREAMWQSAKFACYYITQLPMPDLCIDNIFSYLHNRDLSALIASVPEDLHF